MNCRNENSNEDMIVTVVIEIQLVRSVRLLEDLSGHCALREILLFVVGKSKEILKTNVSGKHGGVTMVRERT